MVGCRRCKQFGFTHLPLNSKNFRRWLAHCRVTTDTFHEFLHEFVYPHTKIRFCQCCGDNDGWFYEPGVHYTTGKCRPNETPSPAEIVLIENCIHPLYWEYALTGDSRYDLGLPCPGISPYFGPVGNTWDKTIRELEALRRVQ